VEIDNASAELLHDRFRGVLDQLVSMEDHLLTSANALDDEQSVVESYKWMFSILQVAFDCFVWADPERPRFVDIVGPYKKWGGDNADAFYQYAPLDPDRTYRVRGVRGDAVYLSLTVYGGPDDGRYSERIVGSLNDRELAIAEDGTFELWISPTPQDGPTITLAPDAVCAITRDYLEDPVRGRRCTWEVEALDPPHTYRESADRLNRDLERVVTWLKDQVALVPLGLGTHNVVDPPYPVPQQTFGWAAGDAAYAMGSFVLDEGQALVLRGISPPCAFWNLCLWNPLLHTYNYAYEPVTINGSQITYEDDGSWEIVVSGRDPGRPNWLHTQGHDKGRLWFRWFLPTETPEPISAEVVSVNQLHHHDA
jgi:hypothetical protein